MRLESYLSPTWESLGRVLFHFAWLVFVFFLLIRTFWRLHAKRTPMINSARALKVKSPILVLMNHVSLISGIHLYL